MYKPLTALISTAIGAGVLALGVSAPSASAAEGASALTPQCTTRQLSAGIKDPFGASARHHTTTLSLTNASHTACYTGGWVGLGLETSGGRRVDTHAVRVDRAQERLIYLRPGAGATSQARWSDVDSPQDHASGPCFHAPRQILVTPPNSRVSERLPWSWGVVCGDGTIDITPLVLAR